MAYLLISYGSDGLELGHSVYKTCLVDRRKDNKKIKQQKLNTDGSKICKFIEENKDKCYHLTSWNCREYAAGLWDRLVN